MDGRVFVPVRSFVTLSVEMHVLCDDSADCATTSSFADPSLSFPKKCCVSIRPASPSEMRGLWFISAHDRPFCDALGREGHASKDISSSTSALLWTVEQEQSMFVQ